jgi:hypothetical protein
MSEPKGLRSGVEYTPAQIGEAVRQLPDSCRIKFSSVEFSAAEPKRMMCPDREHECTDRLYCTGPKTSCIWLRAEEEWLS